MPRSVKSASHCRAPQKIFTTILDLEKASLKLLPFLYLTILELDCIPQWRLFKSPSPYQYFQRVGPQRRTSRLLDDLHMPLIEILNQLAHISSRTLGEYVESHTKSHLPVLITPTYRSDISAHSLKMTAFKHRSMSKRSRMKTLGRSANRKIL